MFLSIKVFLGHSRYFLPCKLLLLLFICLLIPSIGNAQISFDVSKTANLANCTPGQQVTYSILYSCSSLTNPCEGGTITDALPTQFEFVSALGTNHTTAATYNSTSHTVTFTFLPSIPPGSTGQLKIFVKAKTGLPGGANPTTNCANSALTNSGIVQSSCANVTINTPAPVNLFTISKTKASPSGTPFLGKNVTYDISVCNPANAATNGGVSLLNAVVKDSLPPNAVFVSATNGGTYNNGIVTWNLGTLTASNTASCTNLSVTVMYPSPPFSAGMSVINTATLKGNSNGSAITVGPATTTHSLQNPVLLWTVNKTKSSPSGQAYIGNNITYEISFCNPSNASTNGGLDVLNAVMIDTLPVGATYVSSTLGGVYNAGNHTVTWNLGDQIVTNTAFCTKRQVVVNYPAGTFSSGATVCNGSAVFGNAQGYPNGHKIGASRICHTVITFVPVCNASISKSISSNNNLIGESQTYNLNFDNTGDLALNNLTFEDVIPNALNLTEIRTGQYSGTPVNIAISYQTNVNGSYTTWTGSPFSSASNQTLLVSALGLGANYITKIRLQFGTVPVGFSTTQSLKLIGTLINPAHGGTTVSTGNTISNCGDLTWDCSGSGGSGQSCSNFTVDALSPSAS
ncbi:MAG: hypothetical protein ACKVTZ_05270, partial [Bacteroidia bacterium]